MNIRQVDYSTRDYEGFRKDLIEKLKEKMPEYTDFSQSDAGIVILELLAHGLDLVSYYNDVVANEVFLSTARERESVIKRAGGMGYILGNATSAEFEQVFEIIPQEEDYLIPKGTRVSTDGDGIEPEIIYETVEDLVIPAGEQGIERNSIDGVESSYLYSVVVEQGHTIQSEILGTSSGLPDQKFKLGYKPVLEDSVELFVNEGAGNFRWDLVRGFLNSDQESRHFTFEVNEQDEASIQFGSGYSGRIPVEHVNGISATYKIGGGTEGNVAPYTIVKMPNKPALVKRTFNPGEALKVALDKESISEAKVKAPASLRTLDRAVTLNDFRDLALIQKDVRKASSIKNEELNVIDVCVLPVGSSTLSERQKEWLEEYFERRVLLGVDFRILSAEFVPVDINIHAVTTPQYYNESIQLGLEQVLEEYFEEGNREFGEVIYPSTLSGILANFWEIESITLINPKNPPQISPYQIPILGTVNIAVDGGKDKGGEQQ